MGKSRVFQIPFLFAQTSAYSSVVLEVKEECIGREQ